MGKGLIWSPCGSSKNLFSRERVKIPAFCDFIIISHILFENIIEITQVVQKTWRFSSSTLTIFNVSGFKTFLCYKEANDVSI